MGAAYVGNNNNQARIVKNFFVSVNNTAKKVSKLYLGVNGVAKIVYRAKPPYGYQEFLSNGIFYVPKNVVQIRVTACGAGGGGGKSFISGYSATAGGGGGGGAAVVNSIYKVSENQQISIIIGIGGTVTNDGGATIIGSVVTLPGGKSGGNATSETVVGGEGAAGGLGGGAGGKGGIAKFSFSAGSGSPGIDGIQGKGGAGIPSIMGGSTLPAYQAGGGGGGGSLGDGAGNITPTSTRGGGGYGESNGSQTISAKAGANGYVKIEWGF